MTHASLCKRTYKMALGFHPMKSRRMVNMRFHSLTLLLLVASAAMLPAQEFTITTTSLPGATVGVPYSAQLEESGGVGAISWSLECDNCGLRTGHVATSPKFANGATGAIKPPHGLQLPAGLNLNPETGVINGTPTTPSLSQFTIYAEDSDENVAYRNLAINVAACAPTISPTTLPNADVNFKYPPVSFTASGCSGTFTFTSQPNPPAPGLYIEDGTLTGTPTAAGTYSFSITANGPNQETATASLSVTVNPPPTITTASPLPSGPVGVAYSQQIAATGGVPPYTFAIDNTPPGIVITPSGLFSGTPTQAGTFSSINIEVKDSLGDYTETPFQVTFTSASAQVQVSPLSLTFKADFESNPPLTQAISVVPTSGATPPVSFSVIIDGGQNNSQAPAWISVSPTSGDAPAGLVVSVNQGTLAVGSYLARIRVVDSNSISSDVTVTLNVTSTAEQLTVAPSMLRFGARAAAPGTLVQDLLVSNAGIGSLAFTTSVVGGSSWISGISPSSGQATLNTPVLLQVTVNTSGLPVGNAHDIIRLTTSAGNVDVPISLFVAAGGPVLAVNTTGALFQARQNGGSTVSDNIEILNIGDPSSTVNWTATLVTGSNFLSLGSSSGTATATAPGTLSLSLTAGATQLTPGPYYALVQIADSNSLNSPQFVIAVLNLEPDSALPSPQVSPAGVFFTTQAAGATPTSQQVLINTSSASAVPFQVATSTNDQGSWLSATPSSGTASGQSPGGISITASPSGLAAGVHTGNVNVSISGVLQSVNVTFVVQPAGSNSDSRSKSLALGSRPQATGCTPSKLAITETSLPNNFAVPAGWPATLIVQLNDDCGASVTDGNVIAGFSNGDPALALISDSLGNYSATWQPGGNTSEMVITLNATAGTLQAATATLYGGVDKNPTPPPTLAAGGTVNDFNPVAGAALSPGMIAQVYGSGLATSPVSTLLLPLPTLFDNTFAQVGGYQAPIYFLSNAQLNVQIPAEIAAPQQIPMLLSVNNALTLPITLDIIPGAPGVLSAFDGPTPPSTQNGAHIVAQHLNGSSVTSSSPGKPGEYLVMYLTGLGATKPSVKSGAAAPGPPSTLATVTMVPTVTVDSLPSTVYFAGLAPGFVGLYQIDFQVPTGAKSGDDVVTVTQNGIAANSTLLPVGQ
jgi:uncharacterized protein (TIGR03437 family)